MKYLKSLLVESFIIVFFIERGRGKGEGGT